MAQGVLLSDLAKEIQQGQVVALVGAGVSVAASGGAPEASWTGLLAAGVERCGQVVPGLDPQWGDRVRAEIASGDLDDLLSAAEKVTRKLGGRDGGEYARWLRETVGALELRDPAVPQALANLGVSLVTTNYDGLLEAQTGLPAVTWRDSARVQRILRGDGEGIVYLHGHYDEPESVVLGLRSYEDVLRDPSAQALLHALAMVKSFLLVGFGAGLDDPNFAALRSWMAQVSGGSEYRHYRLVLDGDVAATQTEHDPRERITVVGYGARHEDLAGVLSKLGRCQAARVSAGRRGRTGSAAPRRPAGAASEAAERRYREVALRAFDIIDLANLPENDRHLATRDLELRRLYVALQIEIEVPAEAEAGQAEFLALEQRRAERVLGTWSRPAAPGSERIRRVSIGERLGVARRLVVLGDPGAGKTTLLRWLATAYLLRLQGDPDLAELPDAASLPDEDLLPVLIRCRDLDQDQLSGPIDAALHRSLRRMELHPDECDAVLVAVRRRLDAGSVLMLIDGLDEITDQARRAGFCRQVEQLCAAHPCIPIVVTSRIVGYRELGARIGRGFEHVTVSDLTREEKDQFAARWCALAEPLERRADAEAGLIQDLHSSHRIEALTGNPMLLTTMALVRRRVGKLPSQRYKLYEKAVEVLLNWRKEVDEPLDEDEALPQLHCLAYTMCDRGVQQLRRDEAIALLCDFRDEFPQLRRVTRHEPEDFLRLLERRTGMLTESGEIRHDGAMTPVYEFRHLTFQEYLASLALIRGHHLGSQGRSLAERVGELAGRISVSDEAEASLVESWREPLRLCLAACNDGDADDVLRAILTPAPGEDPAETGRARAVQAVRCLADEPNVTEAVAKAVLRVCARQIDDRDGRDGRDDAATTVDAAMRELAGSQEWAGPLEHVLCEEFRSRKPAARAAVGRVHGFVSDALRPSADAYLLDWLQARVAELAAPDDLQAIRAALHARRAAHLHSTVLHEMTQVGETLTATLARPGPVAHAGAAALAELVCRSRWRWRPTTECRRRLHASLIDPDTDTGALAHSIEILGACQFSPAASALADLLDHRDPAVRQQSVLALAELGDCRAADPLVTLLRGAASQDQEAIDPRRLIGVLRRITSPHALPALLDLLSVCRPKVRELAARVLGVLGDGRAVEPLLACLEDADGSVRQGAAVALGELGDGRAVEPLLERLEDADGSVRQGAAAALGGLGDARAVEPLLERLEDSDAPVRWNAAWALGVLGDGRAVEPLLERLEDADGSVRQGAAAALGELGDGRAVEPLLERLDDADGSVRVYVAWALGVLGDARVVEPLLRRLEDSDAPVRWNAAWALGELGDGRAVEPLLERLGDADGSVRVCVAGALGVLGDVRAVEPLVERFGDLDPDVRAAAAGAVGRLADDRHIETLLGKLGHTDDLTRSAAARALGVLSDKSAVEPLWALLDDADGDMRAAAALACGQLGDAGAVEPLLTLLADAEPDVREEAAAALGELRALQAVEPLLARLEDPALDVHIAAMTALGRLGDRRAAAPLHAGLGSHPLRQAAAVALGRIGDPSALAELRRLLRAPVRDARVAGLAGLSQTCEDENDRKLLTWNVNGEPPFLDPQLPVRDPQLRRAVRKLGLSEEEVRRRYDRLAERFALTLA